MFAPAGMFTPKGREIVSEIEVQRLDHPPQIEEKVHVALIDGSITYALKVESRAEMAFTLPTPAGESPPFYLLHQDGVPFWYVPYHGIDFMSAADNVQVGFTRVWYVLHVLGVRDAISAAFCGSASPHIAAGDLAVMTDLIDFSFARPRSILTEIWERLPWMGVSFSPPLCPELGGIVFEAALSHAVRGNVIRSSTAGQFEGHRFGSPAEVRMARTLGVDVLTHHLVTEAIYARELGIHFSALNYVSNVGAGMGSSWGESIVEIDEQWEDKEAGAAILLSAVSAAGAREMQCDFCPRARSKPVMFLEPAEPRLKPVFR